MNFEFELTPTPITSTAGLAFIGDQLAEQKFLNHIAAVCPQAKRKDRMADADIVRSMIGLIALGKPHFDAITEYQGDSYFPQSLRLDRLPSAERLRQRIQALPEKMDDVFRDFTIRQLRSQKDLLGENHHGTIYCVAHVDVAPMDNSDTKKEGVSYTYKKFTGYAPIFAYIGPGFMLNNELREGSSHCNCDGTKQWLEQTLKMAAKVSPHPRLLVTDAGHDSSDNLQMLEQMDDTEFVIKRNPRKEDRAEWLQLAKSQSKQRQKQTKDELPYEKLDIGAHAWYGERTMSLANDPETELRVTFRVIERFADARDGQFLFEPQITIEAYWTSLDWTPQQIQQFYQKRGTSEQYHSEFKTDLDMERLPSGKFATNQHLMDMGMIAYNLLRSLGQRSLKSGLVPGRKSKSKRLRLRTVMQNLIYMAGRIVRHARRHILRIFEGHGWASTAMALARGPG